MIGVLCVVAVLCSLWKVHSSLQLSLHLRYVSFTHCRPLSSSKACHY